MVNYFYENSFVIALLSLYPNNDWKIWLFDRVPRGTKKISLMGKDSGKMKKMQRNSWHMLLSRLESKI